MKYLKFDKIFLIVNDNTDFSEVLYEFKGFVSFVNHQAKCEKTLFKSLVDFKLKHTNHYDYILSVDIDEFLIIKEMDINLFLKNTYYQDCYFFPWAINCSVLTDTDTINDSLSCMLSKGHTGKSFYKKTNLKSIKNEHIVEMNKNSKEKKYHDITKDPYILHCTSRCLEDLVYRGIFQCLKKDNDTKKYINCLKEIPKKFYNLPNRFRIAYIQRNLPKEKCWLEIPKIKIDKNLLKEIMSELHVYKLENHLFDHNYDVQKYVEMYPEKSFMELIKITGRG